MKLFRFLLSMSLPLQVLQFETVSQALLHDEGCRTTTWSFKVSRFWLQGLSAACSGPTVCALIPCYSSWCEGENCNNSRNQENHGTSLNTFKEINNFSSKKKRRHFPGVLPFTGLTHAHELNRNCCQNGGTCFLGTFCICPKYFTGRHCEHDKSIRFCGTVRHGQWAKDSCLLCQCVHGVLHFFPRGLRDGYGLTKENPPDWMQVGPRSEGLSLQHKAYLLSAPALLPLLWQLL